MRRAFASFASFPAPASAAGPGSDSNRFQTPASLAPRLLLLLLQLQLLLLLPSLPVTIVAASSTDDPPSAGECVLCRQCGADVSDGLYLVNQLSPAALVRGNQSLFGAEGVHVQVLQNPLGVRFRVVTFSEASCAPGHTWHHDHSWFPGYVWRHCLCPRCGQHLGWTFIPQTFAIDMMIYVLSLDSVVSEKFSDSLMIVPKAFRS